MHQEMAENLPNMWSDHDSNSSRLGSAASFLGDSVSYSSGILTENSSLFSMSEDDFDYLATLKAKEMFEEVDRVLYENSRHESLEMKRECEEWKAKFPHLRIVGQKILDSMDHGFKRYSPASVPFSGVNSKMANLEECSNLSCLMRELSVKGEKVDARQNGNYYAEDEEETIDLDGDYEEIFALDYNSEEKRNLHCLSRGYPPITPINNLRDFVVSSLCNKILGDLSSHVVDLVLQCKSKQNTLSEESVKTDDESKKGSLVPPQKSSLCPSKSWNCDGSSPSHHILSSKHGFPFKPSDLQVVPEDSRLDANVMTLQIKSARSGEKYQSPSRASLQAPERSRTPGRPENLRPHSSLLLAAVQQQSPRGTPKSGEGGRTWLPFSRVGQSKQPLPHINRKPLTASNNAEHVSMPSQSSPSKTHLGMTSRARVKSLPFIGRGGKDHHHHHQSSAVLLTESFTSGDKNLSGRNLARNFVQENIKNVSMRKVLKPQDTMVSCPKVNRKMGSRTKQTSQCDTGKQKTKPQPAKFSVGDTHRSSFDRGVCRALKLESKTKVKAPQIDEGRPRFPNSDDLVKGKCINSNVELQGELTQRANSAFHSSRDARFSARQHQYISRFGDKLGHKFDGNRPNSTQTYYSSSINKVDLNINSPTLITLPELNEHKRHHSGDPTRRLQSLREPVLRPLTNKQILGKRKNILPSTMPQIPDGLSAGCRRGTLPSKPRAITTPFR